MSFLGYTTKKYEVHKIQKSQNISPTKTINIIQIQKSNSRIISNLLTNKLSESSRNLTPKITYLKRQAAALELQLLAELTLLQDLHRQEIEMLKKEFRKQDIRTQKQLHAFLKEQDREIQNIVESCVRELLEMDVINRREVEKQFKKLLKLGERNEVIWGRKTVWERWEEIKIKLKRLF